jgi:hypothetical protein
MIDVRHALLRCVVVAVSAAILAACGPSNGASAAAQGDAPAPAIKRPGFLGAFFRPQGTPPFGVFSVYGIRRAPTPYPEPTTDLFGPKGYCDAVAANGVSISTGYVVDTEKVADIVDLGVRWTRTAPSPFFDDGSHIFATPNYAFGDFDSAQCALARHNIVPLVAMEAGPVQYNSVPDRFSPVSTPHYKTASDFAQWCGAVAAHERKTFAYVHRYSLPGNEVNSSPALFPGGEAEIAGYSEACYRAIKAADPHAFVYAFELNMDRNADPTGFVRRLYALGCKLGTCYDGISLHLSLRYPIRPSGTPCYPNPGGDYDLQCIEDIRTAAHAHLHVIVGETGFFVPSSVPDEATKAEAVVAAFRAFASDPFVDGVNYANIDECDLYPTGYFVGGCLVDSIGNKLPAYAALRDLTKREFDGP